MMTSRWASNDAATYLLDAPPTVWSAAGHSMKCMEPSNSILVSNTEP